MALYSGTLRKSSVLAREAKPTSIYTSEGAQAVQLLLTTVFALKRRR